MANDLSITISAKDLTKQAFSSVSNNLNASIDKIEKLLKNSIIDFSNFDKSIRNTLKQASGGFSGFDDKVENVLSSARGDFLSFEKAVGGSMSEVSEKTTRASTKVENEVEKVENAIKNSSSSIKNSLSKVNSSFVKFGDTAKTQFKKAVDASKKFATVFAAGGVVTGLLTNQVSKYGNEVQSLDNKLLSLTGSQEKANKEFQDLYKIAQSSKVPIDKLVSSFQRFDLANQAIGGNSEETKKMLESLSKGLQLAGATTEETSSVMLQLSQAFGSGKLQGDEFRALSEAFPSLLNKIAKEMGVTRGELKELGSDGKITSDIIKKTLLNSLEDTREKFNSMNITIGQATTMINNSITKMFRDINKQTGIFDKVSEVLANLATELDKLTPYIVNFINNITSDQVEILAGAILGALVPAFIALGGAVISATLPLLPFIAVGILVAKNFDTIKEAVNNLLESFGGWEGVFESVKEIFTDVFTTLQGVYQEVFDSLIQIVEEHKETFMDVFQGIEEIVTTILDGLLDAWENNTGGIQDIVSTAWDLIKYNIETVLDTIKTIINVFLKFVKGDWSGAWEAIKNLTSRQIERTKEIVSKTSEGIKRIWGKLKEDSVSISKQMWEAIKSTYEDGKNKVAPIVNQLLDLMRQSFEEIANTKAYQWGEKIITMFIQGIKEQATKLVETVKSIAQDIKDFLGFSSPPAKGPASDSDKWMGNMIDMFIAKIKEKMASFKNAVKEIPDQIFKFVGFGSPTKEGPAKDSDKWMPNMMKMFVKGIINNKNKVSNATKEIAEIIKNDVAPSDLEQEAERIAKEVAKRFEDLGNRLSTAYNNQKKEVEDLRDTYQKDFDKIGDNFAKNMGKIEESHKNTIDKLSEQQENLNKKFSEEQERLLSKFTETQDKLQENMRELEAPEGERQTSFKEDVAKDVLKMQAELDKLLGEDDQSEDDQTNIKKIQDSLQKNAEFVKQIENELQEQKKLNEMDELSRKIYLFNQETEEKKAKIQEQIEANKLMYETELADLQNKHAEELKQIQDKIDEENKRYEIAKNIQTALFELQMQERRALFEAEITGEIKLLNKLAEAARKAQAQGVSLDVGDIVGGTTEGARDLFNFAQPVEPTMQSALTNSQNSRNISIGETTISVNFQGTNFGENANFDEIAQQIAERAGEQWTKKIQREVQLTAQGSS